MGQYLKKGQQGFIHPFQMVALVSILLSLFVGLLAYSFYSERNDLNNDLIGCQKKHLDHASMEFTNCVLDLIDNQG